MGCIYGGLTGRSGMPPSREGTMQQQRCRSNRDGDVGPMTISTDSYWLTVQWMKPKRVWLCIDCNTPLLIFEESESDDTVMAKCPRCGMYSLHNK